MRLQIVISRSLVFGLLLCPLAGQWLSYPTAGVPRTPDGKPNLAAAHALQKSGCLWNTFVMVGSGDAFLGLLGATVPHLLAAIGDWYSAPDLDRIYREIEPIDFSQDVLSAAPERLFMLRDGPSGWTDFGSPRRAMDVLQALAVS